MSVMGHVGPQLPQYLHEEDTLHVCGIAIECVPEAMSLPAQWGGVGLQQEQLCELGQ